MRTTLALDDELLAKAQAFYRSERKIRSRPRSAQSVDRAGKRAPARASGRQRARARSRASSADEACMILIDTSVWVDHLRTGDETVAALLESGGVLAHPFVIGALALGHLRQREGSSSRRSLVVLGIQVGVRNPNLTRRPINGHHQLHHHPGRHRQAGVGGRRAIEFGLERRWDWCAIVCRRPYLGRSRRGRSKSVPTTIAPVGIEPGGPDSPASLPVRAARSADGLSPVPRHAPAWQFRPPLEPAP